ncbi:hypothetical protein [Paracoccus sp. (in: a-proteobacteria)]|uniref:hypothetical protein n=1 Tax=Paracoccus sp. TaxID=267 RepID=UPI0028B10404|nr:hypothetical protein [Paracoccus sp. (in: a-proteobacteria)]
MSDLDRQRDIDVEGQRAAVFHGSRLRSPEPDGPLDMIVCRDERQAHEVRRQTRRNRSIRVVSATCPAQFRGFAPQRIIVCEGVDLWRNVDGSGSLEALLRSRQLTWGGRAIFIVL